MEQYFAPVIAGLVVAGVAAQSGAGFFGALLVGFVGFIVVYAIGEGIRAYKGKSTKPPE